MAAPRRAIELGIRRKDLTQLRSIARSRTEPAARVTRARMLLAYREDPSFFAVGRALGVHHQTVQRCVERAMAHGVLAALEDSARPGREPVITVEARAWLVDLACRKAKEFGYPHEVWTTRLLAEHAREHGPSAGHACLRDLVQGTVCKILDAEEVKPHKVRYYLERRDPHFLSKMKDVLLVYQQVALQNEAVLQGAPQPVVITVSVDEKPGVQAIGNTAPDLAPVAGKYPTVARDHEYIRYGTWSILAALDLHDGHITARVEERHRSVEFIALLRDLDAHYPPDCTIRLVLDNHSSHLSKETRVYLATRPNRFKYVLTPTHGSWLNIVETLFGKMTRTFLRQIRVESSRELKERILLGIAEINEMPVVHRWKAFEALEAAAEAV